MKKIFFILPIAALISACSPIIYTSNPQQAYDAQQPLTDQVFYDELSPYGQWIDYPDYGYVWQPNVDEDFRPYDTNGNWVYSEDGWTWVSNYSWGWAPFHYGRWFYDGGYGWMWMPGSEWAPAWVTWGQSGDYYGWAPLPPQINYSANWRPRNEDWSYVPAGRITQVNINNYVVRNNVTVINNTTIINNYNNNGNNNGNNGHRGFTYSRGPKVADVESRGHTTIRPVTIGTSSRPGQSLSNNRLNVYRPVIKQQPDQGKRPAPQRVVTYSGNNQNAARPNARPSTSPNPQQGQQTIRPANGPVNPGPQPVNPDPRPINRQGEQNPRPVIGQRGARPVTGQAKPDPQPTQQAPRQSVPRQQAPRQTAPRVTPQRTAPQQTAPRQAAPRVAPQRTAPRQTAPRVTPQQTAPRQAAPRAAPQQTAPRPAPQQRPVARPAAQPKPQVQKPAPIKQTARPRTGN